jgi:hypothetical protein
MAKREVSRWKVLVVDGSDDGTTVYDGPNESEARAHFAASVATGFRTLLQNDWLTAAVLLSICDCPAAKHGAHEAEELLLGALRSQGHMRGTAIRQD